MNKRLLSAVEEEILETLTAEESEGDQVDVMAELEADVDDIETDLAENEAGEQSIQALEELRDLCLSISKEDFTAVHSKFVRTGISAAMAGLGITVATSKQLYRSLESYNTDSRQVALESIGDGIKKVAKSIYDSIMSILGKIGDFIKKLFGIKAKTEKEIAETKKEIDAIVKQNPAVSTAVVELPKVKAKLTNKEMAELISFSHCEQDVFSPRVVDLFKTYTDLGTQAINLVIEALDTMNTNAGEGAIASEIEKLMTKVLPLAKQRHAIATEFIKKPLYLKGGQSLTVHEGDYKAAEKNLSDFDNGYSAEGQAVVLLSKFSSTIRHSLRLEHDFDPNQPKIIDKVSVAYVKELDEKSYDSWVGTSAENRKLTADVSNLTSKIKSIGSKIIAGTKEVEGVDDVATNQSIKMLHNLTMCCSNMVTHHSDLMCFQQYYLVRLQSKVSLLLNQVSLDKIDKL
jgi:hypothetical protein